jgi:hypothetical protein
MQDGKGEKYNEIEWDSSGDITFHISESTAWAIKEDVAEACMYRWDCFSPELAEKMNRFCETIV